MSGSPGTPAEPVPPEQHGFTNAIVRIFLHSNLSLILIVVAIAVGGAALWVTPREEDPQIVVPLADVYVSFPGHSAAEVEQLVATPLEKILFQIDGVEYVYSMSRENEAIITVRFYVGQDRERSLVKLYKRLDEHLDAVPPGVTGWVVKPVEIDDVPVVTLTLSSATADEYTLRRVGEELVDRLSVVEDLSRAYVVGGRPRVVYVYLDPERMEARQVSPLQVQRALQVSNVTRLSGEFERGDAAYRVEAGRAFERPAELNDLVVGVFAGAPVLLKDVAEIRDGPAEAESYVRHGWGPARGFEHDPAAPGAIVEKSEVGSLKSEVNTSAGPSSLQTSDFPLHHSPPSPAVTIALAKKRGTNAVTVARDILREMASLRATVVPDDIDVVVTRNYGLNANHKVNELIEGLAVAVLIVIGLLAIGLGWREGLIVAVAVPVVFGLTLAVNLLFGYTINRVTLFALILSLGLLVDDPIVDVENIARHFALRKKATRRIVLEAVAEIRPPLITATLAVIVSFLPMFFITGMMGPYMRPMALNVPVTMIMSMLVAFTITPWLAYHMLKSRYGGSHEATEPRSHEGEHWRPAGADGGGSGIGDQGSGADEDDIEAVRGTLLYRGFRPLMTPLLRSKRAAWGFMGAMGLLMLAAMILPAWRAVPLKMLPFDNKNELLLVLDFDEGTTLERSDATVRALEAYLAGVPEVVDFTSYVGVNSPIDFNGMVRHYYLRRGPNVAEIRVNLVGKKHRGQQSHAVGLRLRDDLTRIAATGGAKDRSGTGPPNGGGATLKIVELPPGPPVISTLVAEIYGRPDHAYDDLIAAARTVRARMEREPGVVDVDDSVETPWRKLVFVTDKEKAALSGVSVEQIAETIRIALGGATAGTVRVEGERNPLRIELRLPRALRSSAADLANIRVAGGGQRAGRQDARPTPSGSAAASAMVPLAELGRWEEVTVDRTIYHKNLQRVVYVFAETAGRQPAECVIDIQADLVTRRAAENFAAIARAHAVYYNADEWLDPPEVFIDSEEAIQFVRLNPPEASGRISGEPPLTVDDRTYLSNGGGVRWYVPDGIRIDFAGEGEWQITLDVFRDLGIAFAAALVGIYILLVAQMRSFLIPVVVMLAIPLTVIGIMPGFWLLNLVAGGQAGGYGDPILFTATAMIGMIALSGIVTRQAVIIIDFVHLAQARGHSLFDAILASCAVRLRPILLTVGTAMLSALPITIDPIFSGLAWSLIFGLFASTVFTLFVIPVAYWLVFGRHTQV